MADAADEQMMTVKARDKATGEITTLRVRKDTPMEEIFKQYAEKKNHDMSPARRRRLTVAAPRASARALSARRAAPSRPREGAAGPRSSLTPRRCAVVGRSTRSR